MSTSRRCDRKPENASDTRLFDLWESGYTGPIDQDGYAVTTGPEAESLRALAEARGETVTW
jgi:hypothetical protein